MSDTNEEPRIGVFVCHCGHNIAGAVDVESVAEMAKDLDTCLVLHADHTFNASTFACREVVSTRAHMYAGVTAGIGALSGSLHGGANQEVMKMLFELENEKDIPGWIIKQLEGGGRIMGMGHAVYKTMDPRAKFLKEMGERLGNKTGNKIWHDLSMQIEKYGYRGSI